MPTFYRWVPKDHAEDALASGLVSHNGSAMWIFSMEKGYRPNMVKGRILLAFDLTDPAATNITTKKLLDFEDPEFGGENKHPWKIIVKNNEPGAYGIGRHRQATTNFHTKSRYATKKEVAKALGVSEMEVGDAYRPAGGWGR
ncbi:hypothetical protein [Sagittula stellata]|uniref:Uncharacterized protein n=1 Tax=Sagittula stellata (strain ATCC 700073 / DSM 11524 / E-37) TaxID=388399 RepID=A3JYF1_SAGS3|nr:hypothetical protein [Sagittula stellata]EBA10537.1 hypothetical protein SSE37_21067 [Sagittula stellata E-37]